MHTPIERAAIAAEDELRECDDAYTVDALEGQEPATTIGEESDNESIATNALGDCDTDSNEFDFTSLQGTAKATFDEQAVARVFYEMEGAAPKLGELAAYLRQCNSLRQHDDVARAMVFRTSLDSLRHELGQLINNYEGSLADNTSEHISNPTGPRIQPTLPSYSLTPPRPTPTQLPGSQHPHRSKRSVNEILGASPEKASKRKQSYRPH